MRPTLPAWGFLLAAAACSMAWAGDDPVDAAPETEPSEGPAPETPATETSPPAPDADASGDGNVEEGVEEAVEQKEAASGDEGEEEDATAKVPPPDELHWPLVLAKGGVGFPFPLSARLEVFVLDGLSVEAGITAPFLIPGTVGGGVRWRPRFACLGCDGKLQLRAGMGLEGHTFYDPFAITVFDPPEWMLVASPGATVFWRAFGRFGFSLGARLALGITSGLENPTRIEPTGYLNIELGMVIF